MASKKRARRHVHRAPRRRVPVLTVAVVLVVVLIAFVLLLLFLTSPAGKAGAELGPPAIGPDNPPAPSNVNVVPVIAPDIEPVSRPAERPPK